MATDPKCKFKALIKKGEKLFKDETKQSEALAHFSEMAKRYPDNPYFKIRLAELLINIRKWDEAFSLTSELIKRQEPKFFAYQFHSAVLIKQGKLDEAEELLAKAAELFPNKQKLTTQLFLIRTMKKEITILRQVLA